MKETPERLAPTTKTLRALFSKSGNQCAFPECDHPLIDEDNNFIAQVCHIEDALPGGRFNEDMSNEERRSYHNLILFCYRHHKKTDNVDKFPVEKLKEIKAIHETNFKDPFIINDKILLNIFNDLKSIKEDTTAIRKSQQSHDIKFEELKALIISQKQGTEEQNSNYINEIEAITKLRDSNNHKAALQLLENFKKEKWDKLNDKEKYKLVANMGICHLELGNKDKASNFFIELISYTTENDKALGFIALGYAIQENSEEARKHIKNAIYKNPKNSNAYVALILIERDHMEFSELLSQIPIELRDTQEVSYALGGLARHKNEFEIAITWYQNAIDNAVKNQSDLQAILATTILESITNPFQIATSQVDNESRNKINYSIELLTKAWDEFEDSDLRKSRIWILVNRGIAKKYIGDPEGAFEDIKLAANISENSYFAVKHLTIVAFETNRFDDSLELLDQLESMKSDENQDELDFDLFRAQILYKKKDYEKSIDRLKTVLQNTKNEKIKKESQSLLIFANVAINNFEEAIKISTSIIEEEPDYLRGFIEASKVYAHTNETEEAISLLNQAYDLISDESEYADIQDLAYEFVRHEDFQKAIRSLEQITNIQIYSELSITLLKTYYNAGETGKALNICRSIRSNYGPIDVITEIQSSIYESIGDLFKAIEVCEEYLEIYPDDQRVQVRLAIVYSRVKDEDKLKDILDKLEVLGDLPFSILYQLAHLNISVGEWKRGLEIAFETRRKHNNIGKAHLNYVGLFTEFKMLMEQVGKIQKIVDVNTAVKIKDENGELFIYYILDVTEKLSREELLISDLLTQSLIGASIGDIVKIDRNIGDPQKFEIVDILSKYIYAYHESIELLNKKFVEIDGFRVFNSKGTGDIKKDLKPIFDSIDQSEQFNKQIYHYYHKKILTIGACAQLKNVNPIKFWSIVFGNPEHGIYSLGAVQTEIQIAHILLEKKTGIVIDLISLLTLASINKQELLETIPNKKVVARSSIECIDDLLRDLRGMSSQGYLTIGKVNGDYVREEITKERIDQNRKHYEDLLTWIEKNCEISPCNEALTMNATRKEEYDKAIGKPFIDSILIAKEHNYLLLADEENLRVVASSEFQIKGFPLNALFSYCLKENFIDQETYNENIAELIGLNYKYLPVNSEVLMKCADMSKYQTKFPFDLALKTLDYSISSEDSSINVATYFIYKIYTSITVPQIRLNLILPLLQTLVNGRDFLTVLQKLTFLIEIKFKLLQTQKDEVLLIISDFIRAQKS